MRTAVPSHLVAVAHDGTPASAIGPTLGRQPPALASKVSAQSEAYLKPC
jgi:hypothetical protein